MLGEGEAPRHNLEENCRKKIKLFLTKHDTNGFFFFFKRILFCTKVVDEMSNETETTLIKSCILTMMTYQVGKIQ